MKEILYTVRFITLCAVPVSALGFGAWLMYSHTPGWGWYLLVCWFILNAWQGLEDML